MNTPTPMMTVERGFAITIVSALVFASVGSLLGYAIGMFAPEYYRFMFRIPPDANFNVQQLGLGLGATQGFAAGLVVGLVVVLATAWYGSRVANIAR